MQSDMLCMASDVSASISRESAQNDGLCVEGVYFVECYDKDGNLKWSDTFPNAVVTFGKNLTLDTVLAGSGYTVTGPYMGLIGATPTVAATDTMASHSGWNEVGGANAPTYSGTRKTCAWSAASGGTKSLSSPLSFSMTGAGTVGGCFITLGSGALNTLDSTAGTLLSAGAFTGGNKDVASGDTLNVSYSLSLST